ncbi:hypothetical protein Trydic_g8070 [Trypoxylus dichotomus]
MSALLGVVGVTKLKGKHRWLTKSIVQRVDSIIHDDRRMAADELYHILSLSKGSLLSITQADIQRFAQKAVDGMVSHKLAEDEKVQNCAIDRESYNECVLACRSFDRFHTIISVQHFTTPKFVKARLQRVRPIKAMADVLLLHDNTKPYTSHHTAEEIVKIRREALSCSSYSSALASYHRIHFEDTRP